MLSNETRSRREAFGEDPIRLGVIGLGARGRALLGRLLKMEDIIVPAVCDLYEDRLRLGMESVIAAGREKAEGYKDYQELLTRDDLDGVIISSSIVSHAQLASAAMKAGKHAGIEVGGAASLEECWELVRTSESSGKSCMILSNCNYGRNEMALLNMVKKQLFGELIHCQCGYEHDLRRQVVMGEENKHNRFALYSHRNGDNYPTHGLGPVAKYLNINRGNRFLTLSSISSKSRGLRDWATRHLGKEHPLAHREFAQGDIVTTMIKCAHGETILLTLDTTLPRPYSRAGRVQGTKGLWMEDNQSLHIEGRSADHTWESFEKYREEYDHPLWKEYVQQGIRGGHDGTDYLCLRAFIESIARNIAPPIDVYDTASWMAVTVLTEQSIALGGHPVSFPDFTNGRWIDRNPGPKSKYGLNEIDESLFENFTK